jgi:murein DD-endopeptidase MepM/ murein hydrolase activator NlpD
VHPQPAALPSGTAAGEARGGSSFVWPVRGHILAGYGAGPDGTHNDGINIAAPRGAPVQAVDAGVVAYAGNELRGYGNLLLIKHPGGWISAYAHCDAILVKQGQKIARGQVIARVGSSGNVGTPQLHFELRRGNKPVDPRTYLSPLPSAGAAPAHSG